MKFLNLSAKNRMTMDIDWTPLHSHEPNPEPPTDDPTFAIIYRGRSESITPDFLLTMPQEMVDDCYIVSTGHGTSGPFEFGGVQLKAIIEKFVEPPWSTVDILSADGFRTRIRHDELERSAERPALLALSKDGEPLSRVEGLVRLIVPHETESALQQVKWISQLRVID